MSGYKVCDHGEYADRCGHCEATKLHAEVEHLKVELEATRVEVEQLKFERDQDHELRHKARDAVSAVLVSVTAIFDALGLEGIDRSVEGVKEYARASDEAHKLLDLMTTLRARAKVEHDAEVEALKARVAELEGENADLIGAVNR